MKRHKILFLTGWYPSAIDPMAGVFVRAHAEAASRYDDVVVLHWLQLPHIKGALWTLASEEGRAGAHALPTYHLFVRHSRIPGLATLLRGMAVWAAIRAIVKRHGRPDLIHAHVYHSAVLAILPALGYRIPLVTTEHFSAFPRRLLSRRAATLARFAFARSARVLPVSRTLQDAIAAYGIAARYCVVPNTVDTELFSPPPQPSDSSLAELLFVGRLDENKDLSCLIRALKELHAERADWRLSVIGDGPTRNDCQQLVVDLGLADHVVFCGWKSQTQVARAMRHSNLLVIPSRAETFGVVGIEAMATGLPILATRCGGPEEYLTPEAGDLVPAGQPTAMKQALSSMLDRRKSFDKERIADTVRERFSYEAVGQRLHRIYQELCRS